MEDANAAFTVWKMQGRVTMPAQYHSPTGGIDIDCYVTRQNMDGTLDLGHEPVRTELWSGASLFVMRRADPLLVKPRFVQSWFVPPLEELEAGGYSGAGDRAVIRRSAGGTTATAATEAARGVAQTPGSSGTATFSQIVVVQYPFDPAQYIDGHPYLTLEYGDELERITKEVDSGWTKGRLRKRASGKPCAPGALGYDWGWYPENYAAPRQA